MKNVVTYWEFAQTDQVESYENEITKQVAYIYNNLDVPPGYCLWGYGFSSKS